MAAQINQRRIHRLILILTIPLMFMALAAEAFCIIQAILDRQRPWSLIVVFVFSALVFVALVLRLKRLKAEE